MSATWTPELKFHNPFISAVLICQLHAICKRQADASARRILARCHERHVQDEAAVEANKCDTNGFVGTIHADATLQGRSVSKGVLTCNCAKLYRKVSSWAATPTACLFKAPKPAPCLHQLGLPYFSIQSVAQPVQSSTYACTKNRRRFLS